MPSAAGVTTHAKPAKAAQKFLEWLSSGVAPGRFAGTVLEYPANPAIAPDAIVANWGQFRQDATPLSEAGRLQPEAVRLMDRAGYK